MENKPDPQKTDWERYFAIPASGVVFASSAAMIGAAVAGPIGGFVGVTVGAVGGVINELVAQRRYYLTEKPENQTEKPEK